MQGQRHSRLQKTNISPILFVQLKVLVAGVSKDNGMMFTESLQELAQLLKRWCTKHNSRTFPCLKASYAYTRRTWMCCGMAIAERILLSRKGTQTHEIRMISCFLPDTLYALFSMYIPVLLHGSNFRRLSLPRIVPYHAVCFRVSTVLSSRLLSLNTTPRKCMHISSIPRGVSLCLSFPTGGPTRSSSWEGQVVIIETLSRFQVGCFRPWGALLLYNV